MSDNAGNGSKLSRKELSLEDLEKVAGGGTGTSKQPQEPAPDGSSLHDSAAAAATTVHAPDHLPQQIANVEALVAAHSLTGDQAVSQITGIVAHGDYSLQGPAGAEIASLIARGDVTAQSAIADIHSAVTTAHSLTGDQAVGLLAGIMVAQYSTPGEDPSIGSAARGEIANLVAGSQVTIDHAITALAAAAGSVPVNAQTSVLSEISSLATQYAVPAGQIATDVGQAVYAHDITGEQAVSVLANIAGSSFDPQMTPAVGAEIAKLVSDQQVTPADAAAGVQAVIQAGWLLANQAASVLAAAGEANDALLGPGGAAIGAMLNPNGVGQAISQIDSLVASHALSADHAMTMLAGMVAGNADLAPTVANEIVSLIAGNHLSATNAIAEIQSAVTSHVVTGDQAVDLLLGLATNSGYGASLSAGVNAEISQLIHTGAVTVAQAASDVSAGLAAAAPNLNYGAAYQFAFAQSLGSLMAVAATGVAGAETAVSSALANLLSQKTVSAADLIPAMAAQMGNTALAGAIGDQITALVSSHAISADAAVTALANAAETISMAPKQAIAQEIGALVTGGQIGASQAMADLATLGGYGAANLIALVAAQSAALMAAAVPSLVSLLNASFTASQAITAIDLAITNSGMPVDKGIALMAAAVGTGTAAGLPAAAVATEIANLIAHGNIVAPQAIADLDAAVAGHILGAHQAIEVLVNMAAGGNSALQMAAYAELASLVSHNLVTAGDATNVLNALAASASGNAALESAITEALAVASSQDPATVVFAGLDTQTDVATLASAADHLYAMVQGGQAQVQAVMADIGHALTASPPTLTAAQATTLLADIAGHGGIALQSAAGIELASVVASAGPVTNPSWQAALDDALYAQKLTPQGAAVMLAAMIGAPATSDPVRSAAEAALGGLIFTQSGGTQLLTATIKDMTSASALSGAQAIRVAFVMSGYGGLESFANSEIVSLITSNSVSVADVHTAITTGWWQIDGAVTTLAGIASDAAAINELLSLVGSGAISPDRLISDIHAAVAPTSWGVAPSVDNYVHVLGALAASGGAAAFAAVTREVAAVAAGNQITAAQLATVVQDAGSQGSALADAVLGQLAANTTSAAGLSAAAQVISEMVGQGVTTLDHALGVMVSSLGAAHAPAGIAAMLTIALATGELTAGQIGPAVDGLVASHALTADQAVALLCGLVAHSSAPATTNAAGAEIAHLIAAGQIPATQALADIQAATGAGLSVNSALALLSTFAASTDANIQSAVADEVLLLSPSPGAAVTTLLGLAAQGNAGWQAAAGDHLAVLVSMGRMSSTDVVALVETIVGNHGLPGGNAMVVVANMGAHLAGADRAAAFAAIATMITNGQGTPAQAVAALVGITAGANATLQQVISSELRAIIGSDPAAAARALSGIGDAITAHTLTGPQAAALLVGMSTGGGAPGAVIAEIAALVAQQQIAPADVTGAVDAALASGTLTPGGAIALLANCVAASPALEAAAGHEILAMIAGARIDIQHAISALNGAIGSPLAVDQAIGLFVGMVGPGGVNAGAIAANLGHLVQINELQIAQVISAIDHVVSSRGATADQAIALLASLAGSANSALSGAAVTEIAALAAANGAVPGQVINDIVAAVGGAQGLPLLVEIAAQATPAFQAQFGLSVAGLVAQRTVTAAQAIAGIDGALAAHAITADQALTLLANMSAGVAATPPASALNQSIYAEIQKLIATGAVSDVHAIAVLSALAANGGPALHAAASAEVVTLAAGDAQAFIDAAAQLTTSMNDAGAQLATLINAGKIDAATAMQDIVGASALTPAQKIDFIAALVGHGTSDGWAVNNAPSANNGWLAPAANAIANLITAGATTPAAAMARIDSAVGTGAMTGNQAVVLLAGVASNSPQLQAAAALEISSLVAENHVGAAQAVADVGNCVHVNWNAPGLLSPDQAVGLLAMVGAAQGATPALLSAVGTGLAAMVPQQISVFGLVNDVAQALGGAQALPVLVSLGAHGDPVLASVVGQTLETMVDNHRLTMADIHGALVSGALPPNQAITVLGSMGAPSAAALAEIAFAINAGNLSSSQVIGDIHAAMSPPPGSPSMTAGQAVAVLTSFAADDHAGVAQEIASYIGTGKMTSDQAVAAIAGAAGHGTAQALQNAAALLNALFGSSSNPNIAGPICSTVPGSLTADQAAALLLALQATNSVTLEFAGRSGILALLQGGQLSPQQAMNDIGTAVAARQITADQAMAVISSLAVDALSNPNAAPLLAAAGSEVNALVAAGRISAAQAIGDIDHAVYLQGSSAAQSLTAALQGGLAPSQAVTLLAAIVATGSDPAVQTAANGEIATLITSGRILPADAVGGIQAAVASHALSADQALAALANMLTIGNNAVQTAASGEISALVSGHLVGADHAVAVLAGLANHGTLAQQAAVGAAVSALVASNQISASRAISDLDGAVTSHALGADQALAVLAGIAATSPSLQGAVDGEIVHLVTVGQLAAGHAITVLEADAGQGTGAFAAGAGGLIGALVAANPALATQAMSGVTAGFESGALSPPQAIALLSSMAGAGGASLQVAVGAEIAALAAARPLPLSASALDGLDAAVAAHNLTAAQAVVVIAAAVANAAPGMQTPIAAHVGTLVAAQLISAQQATSAIDNAVRARTINADQALVVLAHVSEGGNAAVQQAAAAEVAALVAGGAVTPDHAVAVLVASGHTPLLESLVGGMLANLVANAHVAPAQIIASLMGQIGGQFAAADCVGVLMGMSAAGGPSAQNVAAGGIAQLIQNHKTDIGNVMGVVDAAVTSHTITPVGAVDLLLNLAAANVPPDMTGRPASAVCASEVASLVSRNILGPDLAFQALLQDAETSSVPLFGALGDITGSIISQGSLPGGPNAAGDATHLSSNAMFSLIQSAVGSHAMTADQALVFYGHLAATGHAVGNGLMALVGMGTTPDHAVAVLATEAAHGSPQLQAGIGGAIVTLVEAHLLPLAKVMADIQVLVVSHAVTADQAVGVLIGIAATNNPPSTAAAGTYQAAAGAELAALLHGNLISSAQATQDIEAALLLHQQNAYQATIEPDQAVIMLMGAAVGGDPATQAFAQGQIAQQIAWGSITGPAAMAAIQAAVASHVLGVDQVVAQLTALARVAIPGGASLQDVVDTELSALIGSHQITAVQLVDVLANVAAGNNALTVVAGGEIYSLIASKLISATDAIAGIDSAVTANHLSGDQAVAVLAGVSSVGDAATQSAVVAELDKLVAQGHVSAIQVATDIVAAVTPSLGYGPHLLSMSGATQMLATLASASVALRDAAATELATVLANDPTLGDDLWSALSAAVAAKTVTLDQSLALLADVAFHGNPAVQGWALMQVRDLMFVSGKIDPVHGVAVLAGLAADGDTAMEMFVAREIDQLTVPGFLTTAQVIAGVDAAIASQGVSPDQGVVVLAGIAAIANNVATSSAVALEILDLERQHVLDAGKAVQDIGHAIGPNGLTADQAMLVFSDLYNTGQADLQNPVATEVVTLIVNGQISGQHAIADIVANVSNGHLQIDSAISMLAGMAVDGRVDLATPVANEIASLTLQEWGVPAGSATYTMLANGLQMATHEFISLANGSTTAASALAAIQAYADAHSIPAEAFLGTMLVEVDRWSISSPQGSAFATSAASQTFDDIQAGSLQSSLAHLVVTGVISQAVAEQMSTQVANAVFPNLEKEIFARIQDGWPQNMANPALVGPVPPGDQSLGLMMNAAPAALLHAAIDLLNVDIRVDTDAPLVIAGKMSANDAMLDIKNAAATSLYAIDIGLSQLAALTVPPTIPGGVAHYALTDPAQIQAAQAAQALATAHNAILQEIAIRLENGATANTLGWAVSSGIMTPTAAIQLALHEADAGRTDTAMVEGVALAHLGEIAALWPTLSVNVGYMQQMLGGVSALSMLDLGNLAQHMDFAKTLFTAYVAATTIAGDAASAQQQGSEAMTWYETAWAWLENQKAVAMTFGNFVSLTEAVRDPATADAALKGMITFGLTFATQSVPLGTKLFDLPMSMQDRLINQAITGSPTGIAETPSDGGIPEWFPELATKDALDPGEVSPWLKNPDWTETLSQTATGVADSTDVLQAGSILGEGAGTALGEAAAAATPADIFVAIGVASKVLPLIFAQNAVANEVGNITGLMPICKMVSAACDAITNSITGVAVVAGQTAYQAAKSFGATVYDIGEIAAGKGSTASLQSSAEALGEGLFSLVFGGTDVNAFVASQVDQGKFMIDLFSGNTGSLKQDALQIGQDEVNLLTTNIYAQVILPQLENFGWAAKNAFTEFLAADEEFANTPEGKAFMAGGVAVLGGGTGTDIFSLGLVPLIQKITGNSDP